jgi:hypothetical protein
MAFTMSDAAGLRIFSRKAANVSGAVAALNGSCASALAIAAARKNAAQARSSLARTRATPTASCWRACHARGAGCVAWRADPEERWGDDAATSHVSTCSTRARAAPQEQRKGRD